MLRPTYEIDATSKVPEPTLSLDIRLVHGDNSAKCSVLVSHCWAEL